MELTPVLLFLIALSGFIKGFVGFGLSLILISVLLTAGIAPSELLPILVPLFVVLDILLFIENRKHAKLNYKENFPLHYTTLISVFVGLLIGAYALLNFEASFVKLIFAIVVLLIIFALIEKVHSTKMIIPSEKSNTAFGFIAGILTGLFTLNSATVSIYLLFHEYSKEKYMGALVTFTLITDILIVALFAFLGLFTIEGFKVSVQLIGIVLIGFIAGSYLRRVMPSHHFKALVIFILTINSVKIIFDFFFV